MARTAKTVAEAVEASAVATRIVGYARTSTVDQKLNLQLDALRAIGADPIHTDQISGVRTARPGLDKVLRQLQPGDTLAVWKLDRLGRSLSHLVHVIAELQGRGVGFRSLTEGIDTATAHGRLLLGLFGSLAEFERELIKERIAAGRDAAKRRGQRFGPMPKMTPSKVEMARSAITSGQRPESVARDLGVSRATMYAAFAKANETASVASSLHYEKRGKGRPKKQPASKGEDIV